VKVLWITERFPPDPGGMAVSAARQVGALAPLVERLDVLRLTADLPPAAADLETTGTLTVCRVGRARAGDESLQILARTAANLLARHGHALVHGFGAGPAGYVATTVARAAGVPAAVSLRGNDVERAMFHGARLPFLLWTLAHADALLGVSRDLLATARALGGRTHGLHHVPNAVDPDVFRPDAAPGDDAGLPADLPRPWIAFSGEARLKKGLPLLLELAEHLAAARRGTLILLGGVRADEREALARWRRRAGTAAARLREVPYADDVKRLAGRCAAMDLFVFPSLWDGMPNAVLEAMAAARPVVAAAVGAVPEIIRDGETGFLVPPDRLQTFATDVLRVLARGPGELSRVGAAARARVVDAFGVEAERDGILAVYRTLGA
jgi:glycosyltransferase involved in cell wall biosynthesis